MSTPADVAKGIRRLCDRTGQVRTEKLEAYIWHCGDDTCDCNQAVIVKGIRFLGRNAHVSEERVWEGTFFSEPTADDWVTIRRELVGAAVIYGITVDPTYQEAP